MRIEPVILASGLIFAAASPAIPAPESSWTVRFHGAIIESTAADQTIVDNGAESRVETDGGLGIGLEYRFSDRYGLEFSTLFAGLEVGSSISGGAGMVQSLELSMMPLTVAVPFHFHPGGRADLFVAPTFSVVHYVDIESTVSGTAVGTWIDVDSDPAPGAAVGIDIPFEMGRWAFSAGLRYMKTSAGEIDVDPVIVTFGLACRF